MEYMPRIVDDEAADKLSRADAVRHLLALAEKIDAKSTGEPAFLDGDTVLTPSPTGFVLFFSPVWGGDSLSRPLRIGMRRNADALTSLADGAL